MVQCHKRAFVTPPRQGGTARKEVARKEVECNWASAVRWRDLHDALRAEHPSVAPGGEFLAAASRLGRRYGQG